MKKRKSILWSWAISYMILLLFPFLSIFVNHHNSQRNLQQEYLHTYQVALNTLYNGIDSDIDNIQKFYHYILKNDSFLHMKSSPSSDSYFYYHAYRMKLALELYCSTDTTLQCTIYNNHLNYVLSADNGCNAMQYYDYLASYKDSFSDYATWNEFLSSAYNNAYFFSDQLCTFKEPALVYGTTIYRSSISPVNVFISMPVSEISVLQEHIPAGAYFIIQSADNTLYCFNQSGVLTYENNPISINNEGSILKAEKDILLTNASSKSNLTYHLLIPDSVMAANLQSIENNFILNLIITIALSFIGILAFLKLNYRPISELLLKFNIPTSSGNEIADIASTYQQLQKEYHASRLTLQNQNQNLFCFKLLSLLKGRISGAELCQSNHFDIDQDATFALIGFWLPVPVQQRLEYDELNYFVVDNVFCELFEAYTFYHIEDGRYIFYLFNLSKLPANAISSWNDDALKKVNYLSDLISKKLDTDVLGVVSETVEHIDQCKFLYRKVLESFEYQNIYSGLSAAAAQDTVTKIDEQEREVIECNLNAALSNADYKSALQVSEEIFFQKESLPFSVLKVYIFDCFTLLLNTYSNYTANPIYQMDLLNYVPTLVSATSVEELETTFNKILEYTCSMIAQKYQSESRNIVLTICRYVEENYMNQLLSVGHIADVVNRNPKYISRVFKQEHGEGLLDYINSYRISKATELMHNSSYTLNEISEMVGYSNIQSFRRAFTKFTGKNPSDFKK